MQRAGELAQVLARKSPTIMALGRTSFLRANDLDYRRNVENQIETLCNVFETADGREGLRAFIENRGAGHPATSKAATVRSRPNPGRA